MRVLTKVVFLLAIGTATAIAQTPNTPFQHIVVIIQENRTPDNLFGGDTALPTGANISPIAGLTGNCQGINTFALQPQVIYSTFDIGHTHEDFLDLYNNGKMNGANLEYYPGATMPCNGSNTPLPFAYVRNDSTTDPYNEVQPYFDIASKYGFANYMFQTNQGPSFPAHQFLFSGTSAPTLNDGDMNSYWLWFAADNPKLNGGNASYSGCLAAYNTTVAEVNNSDTVDEHPGYQPPTSEITYSGGSVNAGFPCYHHKTIADVLGAAGKTWSYYTNDRTSIWTAPNAIWDICGATTVTTTGSTNCPNTGEWLNVKQENYGISRNPAQILSDIKSCSLSQNVVFVTPDGQWSDHAGSNNPPALGPAWVTAIVNGIGQGIDGNNCNYWDNTAIIIVWDDWGGWYDHVAPPRIGYNTTVNPGTSYVYGLRVPLLVVSAYSPSAGYVSGAWTSGPQPTTCPSDQYCHDFGSILSFIEYALGTNGNSLGEIDSVDNYADHWALDGPNGCGPALCPYGLSDFFNFKNGPNTFQPINTPYDGQHNYNADYFIGYTGTAQPPDNEVDDD